MPKEKKKLGRASEKKRKRTAQDEGQQAKRIKSLNDDDFDAPVEPTWDQTEAVPSQVKPFYGLLSEEEQEYFKRADGLLELDDFGTPEEKQLFLNNIHQEANGKELKIACSQSCSRLLERLILLSTTLQKKSLFRAFSGHFLNLVQHRFASHCCETLFLQSVPIVTEELTATERDQATDSTDEGIWVSMENLFLHTLNELGGNLGYLLTNRYASHVLRVLLVVLSGQSGGEFAMRSNLRSKKEKLSQAGLSSNPRNDPGTQARVVPSSFTAALEGLLSEIAAGLDTASLRALAVHPTANPVLQALLELEFSARRNGKAKMAQPLFVKLLPQGWPDLDDADVLFLTNLLYDRIGSHLLETIVRCAPGKTFKWLYRQFLLARIVDAAKHEVATFVAARVVERLGKEDLQHVVELMLPQLRVLVERSRFGIITAMLQRCAVRQVDLAPIHRAFAEMVEGKSPTKLIECMLVWDKGNIQAASSFGEKRLASPGRVDGALLAEAMLELSEPLSSLVTDGLVALSTETLMEMARNHIASRLLQVALMSDFSTAVFRRKYVAKLYEHVAEMAMDPAGSHLVDALWAGTRGMQHCRERIAQELCRKEKELKECHGGRAVWRNWRMNLYKNRRLEWISYSKSSQSLAGDTQRDNPSSAKLKPVLKDTWQRHSADVERRFA